MLNPFSEKSSDTLGVASSNPIIQPRDHTTMPPSLLDPPATNSSWIFPSRILDNLLVDTDTRARGVTNVLAQEDRERLIETTHSLYMRSLLLLHDFGLTMKLVEGVRWTASIFFHRFYVFHSIKKNDRRAVILAALFLALKVEERPIRLESLLQGFDDFYGLKMPKDDMRRLVILIERAMLTTFNFDLSIEHPYRWARECMNSVFPLLPDIPRFRKYFIIHLNYSYFNNICLTVPLRTWGSAMIYFTLMYLNIEYNGSSDSSWMQLIDSETTPDKYKYVCDLMVNLFDKLCAMNNSDIHVDPEMLRAAKVRLEQWYVRDAAIFSNTLTTSGRPPLPRPSGNIQSQSTVTYGTRENDEQQSRESSYSISSFAATATTVGSGSFMSCSCTASSSTFVRTTSIDENDGIDFDAEPTASPSVVKVTHFSSIPRLPQEGSETVRSGQIIHEHDLGECEETPVHHLRRSDTPCETPTLDFASIPLSSNQRERSNSIAETPLVSAEKRARHCFDSLPISHPGLSNSIINKN